MPFTLPRSITVDFSTDADPQLIKAVQGDQTRVAKITLLNKGVPVNLTGLTVRAYVMPFGETVGLYEDVAVTDATAGKVEYSLSGNACIKAGDGVVNIELLETATGKVAYTDEIPLKIKAKKGFVGAIIGSTAFSALQSALTTVQTYLSRIVALETGKIEKAGGSAYPFTAMPYVGTAPIIESGSNANGEYAKFANGTMICARKKLATYAANAAIIPEEWTFPVAFYAEPKCSGQVIVCYEDGVGDGYAIISGDSACYVHLQSYRFVFYRLSGAMRTLEYDLTAIGRWKA